MSAPRGDAVARAGAPLGDVAERASAPLCDLERARAGVRAGARPVWRGRIDQVSGVIVEAAGVPAAMGELCRIERGALGPVEAEVVGFRGATTLLMPHGNLEGIAPRQAVFALGRPFAIRTGPELLGRVLDGFGAPVDGRAKLPSSMSYARVRNEAPAPLERIAIDTPLATGVRAIDGSCLLGRGQRVGIFSGSGVGKSTLLAQVTRGAEADVYTLLGNRSVDPENATLNVYPFWWSNESAREDSAWKMLVPFFYHGREGDARTLITPLGGRGWSESGEEAFVNVLGPLFHHSRSVRRDESRTAFLWPLFERHRRGDERTTRALGLYSRTSSPGESETSYAFWLGHARHTASGSSHRLWPLYSWSDDQEQPGLFDSLTLYGRSEHGDSVRQRLFPLFSSERSADRSSWYGLLGLMHHQREGAGPARSRSWWAWPFVARTSGGIGPGFLERTTLVGSSSWTGGRLFQLGSSLLYSRTAQESPALRRSNSRALLFFTHEREASSGRHVPAAEAGRHQNRIEHESRGFLFDAFVSERSSYHVWREGALTPDEARILRAYSVPGAREGLPDRSAVRAVLEAHGVACADDEPATRAALDSFSEANTETVERRHVRIPLLYGYERTESERSWYGPLGLVSFEQDPEHERFSLLYYGYRSETKGARTSRDIFPFVTWDSGPDETRWSFLWRFLRYERKGERRGGHVLFIPWGDA